MPPSRPPRWIDRWLERQLPRTALSESLRGDLREEYADLAERSPRWVAGLWFTWESARIVFTMRDRGRRGRMFEHTLTDLRIAARSLRRAPGFVALTVLTLALGLGANTTIFAVVRSVVIRPLPFEHVERVVALRIGSAEGTERSGAASFPMLLDLQRETQVFEAIGAWRPWQAALTPDDGAPPLRIDAAGATHEVFDVLGLPAALGRTFFEEDEQPGTVPAAVVSHGFWRGFLGSDPEVLGRVLSLNEQDFTIVGVLPQTFTGETSGAGVLPPATVEVWVPWRNSPVAEGMEFRGLQNVNVVGRLPEGLPLAAAQRDVDRVIADLAAIHDEHAGDAGLLIQAQDVVVGDARPTMMLLFGAVLLVLLLACVNAANLVLGRADGRTRELAVRRVLGASRPQLLRLLLGESLILAAISGAAAAGIAMGGLRVLRTLDPGTLPRLQGSGLDGPTIAFLAVSVLAVGLVLGLVPALQAARSSASGTVRDGGRTGARTGRLRPSLVVVQVAMATVLFAGSALLVRSLGEVLDVEPGFDADRLLTARVDHPTGFVSEAWPEHVAFFDAVVSTMANTTGVESAAAAYQDPADPGWNNSFTIVGQGDVLRGAIFRPITPGYLETAGIPLVAGRDFGPGDDHDAPGVAIVNQAFADRYFEDQDAVGQRVNYGDFWQARPDPEYTIVGVVENVRFAGIEAVVPPAIYFPHAQQPVKEMAFVIRTAGDPLALVPRLRAAVADANPTLPVFDIATVEEKLNSGHAERRFVVTLLGAFAFVALTLAAVGLYGVLSFVVTRRTKEIGVRLAVGARPESVRALVVRQGMLLVALGLAVGIPGALGLARILQGLLFSISPVDPTTHLVVLATILITGLLACLVPARRATRVDPLEALRAD